MALTIPPLKIAPRFGQNATRPREADDVTQNILDQTRFHGAICLERKRTERSAKPFLLMLVDMQGIFGNGTRAKKIEKTVVALSSVSRETDITGWYLQDGVFGVLFTELGNAEKDAILVSVKNRVTPAICESLDPQDVSAINISFHFFPEDPTNQSSSTELNFYTEFGKKTGGKKFAHGIKRAIDVTLSSVFLALLLPVFGVIALLIKLTSKGPVLFRQTRIGQHGKPFTFLKFRSMYVNNDPSIHKEYVSRLIAGEPDVGHNEGNKAKLYKIKNDPRITTFGKFLRKTSLDELPQFLNVLRGEMSVIGPRPPVPYEFERYDIWHRRRVLEIKPGITGLWQVSGRSRTSFDDMVRLDLQYARTWSLWLDLKILLQTPAAVLMGDGAY